MIQRAAIAALLAMSMSMSGLVMAKASAMSGYKWKMRPLLVFAPSEGSASLTTQRAIVASLRPAFQDRHMVVVYIVGDTVQAELGGKPSQSAAPLRSRYGVDAGEFRVILIGKDGGEKLSSGSPIAATALFSTIDAMPMRKDETRRR
ncbi:MAG: hypothetical protein CTY20_04550 [Hyphomicrobium sp.]|nr:MAG: hypothetical protein CTY20_04550 [Hyphomicrobium sp.]